MFSNAKTQHLFLSKDSICKIKIENLLKLQMSRRAARCVEQQCNVV